MLSSKDPETTKVVLKLKQQQKAKSWWPRRTLTQDLVEQSQILTLVSSEAETRKRLSEFQHTSDTSNLWPFNVASKSPETLYILISLSAEEEAINCPFGLNLTHETPLRWDAIDISSSMLNLSLLSASSLFSSMVIKNIISRHFATNFSHPTLQGTNQFCRMISRLGPRKQNGGRSDQTSTKILDLKKSFATSGFSSKWFVSNIFIQSESLEKNSGFKMVRCVLLFSLLTLFVVHINKSFSNR